MKKVISLVMAVIIILSITACSAGGQNSTTGIPTAPTETEYTGYRVANPMARPSYTFDHTPTTDEMREMAVKAMNDMLSIQWSTGKEINYNKTGAVSGKDFHYDPDKTYAGLPYANGQTNIFAWYEYYDANTGRLNFPGDDASFNLLLGNTCTGSLMWAWATVCDSLTGPFINFNMVQKYGCIPMGDITYDPTINSFQELSTQTIIEQNGKDVVMEAYALMKAADAVSSSPEDHGMMAIEAAHVVRDADGKINPDQSYIMIQDQRAGVSTTASKFYEVPVGNEILLFSGRTSYKCTFTYLYNKSYIPVTTAEFQGTEPYAKQTVKFSVENPKTTADVAKGVITCNYPMSVMEIKLVDNTGAVQKITSHLFNREEVLTGVAREYKLSNHKTAITSGLLKKMEDGKTYNLIVRVVCSNGEEYNVVNIPVSKT